MDNWAYDRLSRMTMATQEGLAWVLDKSAKFAYNAAGQLTEIKRYNDLTASSNPIVDTDYTYDDAGRLKILTHKNFNGTTYAGYTYDWDAVNRMTSMDFTATDRDDEDATFNYDDAGQLTGAARSGTANDEGYVYDDNGNRETVSRGGVTNQDWQVGANNQLTRDATYAYEYDDEGNRTKRITLVLNPSTQQWEATGATTEYTWDFRNRLSEVIQRTGPTGSVTRKITYQYDIFDRLIQRDKDPDGNATLATIETDYYIHDGEEQVFHTGSTVAYGSHVYMTGPIKDLVLFDQTDVLYAYLGDHLNTVRDVLEYNSSAWAIDNHVVYDSFGNRTETGGATISPFFGFTGRPFDKDTGLQYNWHRWYDALAGRWMSEDPIGFDGLDSNLARYVSNRVTTVLDRNGLTWHVTIDGATSSPTTIQLQYTFFISMADIPTNPIPSQIWATNKQSTFVLDDRGPRTIRSSTIVDIWAGRQDINQDDVRRTWSVADTSTFITRTDFPCLMVVQNEKTIGFNALDPAQSKCSLELAAGNAPRHKQFSSCSKAGALEQ